MNKYFKIIGAGIKIIWYAVGILLLLFMLITGVYFLIETFTGDFENENEPQLVVGEKLEKAKAEGMMLQGLTYEEPSPIYHTDFFLLPISIKTYENPESGDDAVRMLRAPRSYRQEYYVVNIIFLNKEFETESVLLDKKAFIESFRYPASVFTYYTESPDTLQRNITYLIAFEDSNKDGLIDAEDQNDLYLSDLNGRNLIRITSNVDVTNYYFLNSNEIIIKYHKRNNQIEEHKKEFFARYLIQEKELKDLSSLNNALEKLEKIIAE
jgi:hypothetical protein